LLFFPDNEVDIYNIKFTKEMLVCSYQYLISGKLPVDNDRHTAVCAAANARETALAAALQSIVSWAEENTVEVKLIIKKHLQ